MSNHYHTLEIKRNSSGSEIKTAYRRLAKKYHPDKNKSESAERVFKEISKAYEVLSNPEKRRQYDSELSKKELPADYSQSRSYVYKAPKYSKSALKKGKIFGAILLIVVLIVPFLLLRYSSKYNYEKGLEYYEEGQIPQALTYFDRAIKELGSRKIQASFKAISICFDNGYISQGIAFAQKGNDYTYNKHLKGNLSYREGLGWEMLDQLERADNAYKKALEYGYRIDSVYIHLAMMHGFELENYNQAISYLDYLVDTLDLDEYLLQRGIIHQKLGANEQSILDLQLFTCEYPENGMGHFFLGTSLVEIDQIPRACVQFEKAVELGVKESDAYIRLYCTKEI